MFEAVIGSGFTSDIAIDDYGIVDGPCPEPLWCSFEEDLCGYENEVYFKTDDFDWVRKAGSTPSLKTGPKVDKTRGDQLGECPINSTHTSFVLQSIPAHSTEHVLQLLCDTLAVMRLTKCSSLSKSCLPLKYWKESSDFNEVSISTSIDQYKLL